jgi:hypothetical protein
MNHALHYWGCLAACAEAHRSDALAIARANLMTDWAIPGHIGATYIATGIPRVTQIDPETAIAIATATEGWCEDWAVLDRFHFHGITPRALSAILGDLARRPPALETSLQLGIEAHRLMDCVHETFCGWPDDANRNTDRKSSWWRRALAAVMPDRYAIGHAEYGEEPDTFNAIWYRHGNRIDNRARYIGLFQVLGAALGAGLAEMQVALATAKDEADLIKRCKLICRAHAVDPVSFVPFGPQSAEWKAFVAAAEEVC